MKRQTRPLLLRGGRLVDPLSGVDRVADVLLDHGKIARIGESLAAPEQGDVYEAAGKVVAPGFIDLRARLREPGLEHAETIETGSRAAAAGGFTRVCCVPTTNPCNDSATVTSFIVERARRRSSVRVSPIGALTKGCQGEQLAEIASMRDAGAAAVGDGDNTVVDSALMRRALRYAGSFGLTVIVHCEDPNLAAGGDIHEGDRAVALGLNGIPVSAETTVLARDLILCRETQSRVHVAHVSSAAAVDLLRQAKWHGAPVTGEVAAHHLALSVDDMPAYDSNYKVRPPFRASSDREALLQGCVDGAIDAIVSDHAPHTGNVKMQEFDSCPFGVIAFETAVALALETLVHSGRTDIQRLISLFAAGPSRALGREPQRLAEGSVADLTLLDLERRWSFDAEASPSKSKNTPFHGREMHGGPAATIVGGRLVWDRDQGFSD
ncbi:MAG: amidohydrolase family protein [Acidobacteria bacterium]|nr:amidohydrolase family protein [Acidobacteriota bacterium]